MSAALIGVAIAILAILGIAIVARSTKRRQHVRRLFKLGNKAAVDGKHDEALRLLLAAEREWAFNNTDGSPASYLEDLSDLDAIVKRLNSVDESRKDDCAAFSACISELRELFQDRANFGIDGRMMNHQAAAKWVALSARFDEARKSWRTACATLTR